MNSFGHLLLLTVCALLCSLLRGSLVRAEPQLASEPSSSNNAVHSPQLCTGELPYPAETKFGMIFSRPPEILSVQCPEHYAIFGNLLTGRPVNRNPASVALRATCCPLPAKDILANQTIETIDSCPENFVAVGASQACATCDPLLLCRAINTERYTLSPERPSLPWGFTSSPWKYRRSAYKSDIPRGIRTGVSRAAQFETYSSGCVGYPYGSLLAAKTGKRCTGFLYRALLYRGNEGDPPAGTAVTMFKNCSNLSESAAGELRCND